MNNIIINQLILNISNRLNMDIPNRFVARTPQSKHSQKLKQSSVKQIPSLYLQQGSDIDVSPYKSHDLPFTYQTNFHILMQGFLDKKTLNSSYQSRYFVLNRKRLLYFTDESKNQLKGCFNLVSLMKHNLEVIFQFPQIKFKVCPKGSQEQFKDRFILQLQNQSHHLFSVWKQQIQNALKQIRVDMIIGNIQVQNFSGIQLTKLTQTNQKFSNQYNSNFWNRIDISLEQLVNYSSHLDILLFRSQSPIAYVSRIFMRSYYDHVAIIIKSQLNQTYVFQAIQSRGVCLLDLQTFLYINKQVYEQIGYRKLIFKDKENNSLQNKMSLQQLQIYLNSLLGKKYQLSLSKLLGEHSQINSFIKTPRNNQQIDSFPNNNKRINEQRQAENTKVKTEKTYFCSQLIADIYLKFGLLTKGKAKDYWPKDFQQNQLSLNQYCELTPVMNVCLNP